MTELSDELLSLTDILELLFLAALCFVPLGYLLGRHPRVPGLILVNLFHKSNIVSRGTLSDLMAPKAPAKDASGRDPGASDSAADDGYADDRSADSRSADNEASGNPDL
jgi:hypothetical protein